MLDVVSGIGLVVAGLIVIAAIPVVYMLVVAGFMKVLELVLRFLLSPVGLVFLGLCVLVFLARGAGGR